MSWYDKFNPVNNPMVSWTPNPNGPNWFYLFSPKTAAPTAPQTTSSTPPAPKPAPTPVPAENHMQTYQAIQAYNNGLSLFATLASWEEATKGVVIHKIDEATAMAISERVKPASEQYQLPLTYALGCLAIESTLDPLCQNGNLGPGESNTANDPLGYDMGIAQLKLRYLIGQPGVTDAPSAQAFAFDIDRAIPYFCSLMATKYLWAVNTIQANTSSVPDPRLSNAYLLATGAYNFGQTGMMGYYESGQFPSHCQHVLDLEQYFAKELGVTSIFANLS